MATVLIIWFVMPITLVLVLELTLDGRIAQGAEPRGMARPQGEKGGAGRKGGVGQAARAGAVASIATTRSACIKNLIDHKLIKK